MSGLIIPLAGEASTYELRIDGAIYRTILVDSSGRLLVALDLSALVAPSSVASGQVSVATAGTPVQLPNVACRSASIAARPANAGNVYIGPSTVSATTGRILQPGEVIDIAIDNLNRLYIDAAQNGDGISYLVVS